MTEPLEAGRVIWAEIADSLGNRKLRPAIIVTPTRAHSAEPSLCGSLQLGCANLAQRHSRHRWRGARASPAGHLE